MGERRIQWFINFAFPDFDLLVNEGTELPNIFLCYDSFRHATRIPSRVLHQTKLMDNLVLVFLSRLRWPRSLCFPQQEEELLDRWLSHSSGANKKSIPSERHIEDSKLMFRGDCRAPPRENSIKFPCKPIPNRIVGYFERSSAEVLFEKGGGAVLFFAVFYFVVEETETFSWGRRIVGVVDLWAWFVSELSVVGDEVCHLSESIVQAVEEMQMRSDGEIRDSSDDERHGKHGELLGYEGQNDGELGYMLWRDVDAIVVLKEGDGEFGCHCDFTE